MALNYRTYYAIPHLKNYAEAKAHHDNVKPIRGCEAQSRPAGRREQPWFSIWEREGAIHVGYGRNKELSSRQTLVAYHPNGTIEVHKRNRWTSASDNERIARLLGVEVQTYQYDRWIHCKWYDGGEKHRGWLPIRCNNKRDWNVEPAVSLFTREANGGLVYLNYTYPVTHKPNKVRLKEARAKYAPLVKFMTNIAKLQGNPVPVFDYETRAEFFGWAEHNDYRGNPYPNSAPSLHWGSDVETHRAQFQQWAVSDDPADRMRAALTFVHNMRGSTMQGYVDEMLFEADKSIFDTEVHKGGKLVRDKYRKYFWE